MKIKCPYCNKIIMEESIDETTIKIPEEIPGNYLWHQGINNFVCSNCDEDIAITIDINIKSIKIYKEEK